MPTSEDTAKFGWEIFHKSYSALPEVGGNNVNKAFFRKKLIEICNATFYSFEEKEKLFFSLFYLQKDQDLIDFTSTLESTYKIYPSGYEEVIKRILHDVRLGKLTDTQPPYSSEQLIIQLNSRFNSKYRVLWRLFAKVSPIPKISDMEEWRKNESDPNKVTQ